VVSYQFEQCLTKDDIVIHVMIALRDSTSDKDPLHGQIGLMIGEYIEDVSKFDGRALPMGRGSTPLLP
jgi:hypothetical protein